MKLKRIGGQLKVVGRNEAVKLLLEKWNGENHEERREVGESQDSNGSQRRPVLSDRKREAGISLGEARWRQLLRNRFWANNSAQTR
jgi:hypothetical protein